MAAKSDGLAAGGNPLAAGSDGVAAKSDGLAAAENTLAADWSDLAGNSDAMAAAGFRLAAGLAGVATAGKTAAAGVARCPAELKLGFAGRKFSAVADFTAGGRADFGDDFERGRHFLR